MSVKLLTELSFKGGCTGSSEYKLVKMPDCWKSHVTARVYAADAKADDIFMTKGGIMVNPFSDK